MIKTGRSVEFRGTWRDAIEKYYAYNLKIRDKMGKFNVKAGQLASLLL